MLNKDIIVKSLFALVLLLSLGSVSYAQQTVSGTVVSADDNATLPGVNITVKGTTNGTSTNAQGGYSLSVSDTSSVLVFSFVGFQTQEIEINNRSEINVTLQSKIYSTGEDLVVVGYGTQKKSDLTGSVSSVRGDAITAPAVSNPVQALQGQASGVQIVSSGDPGASPSINIRGIGTTGDSSPLFVVDGVFVNDISYLNNNDIQSIEVLKDASATAIYGSRGANGVVLITTKHGTSEKPAFNFSMSEGVQVPASYSMVNARQYATLLNEGNENAGDDTRIDVSKINNSTNWFDEVLHRSAVRKYNLSFSQGINNNSYFVSFGYDDQNGVVDKSGYKRYSVRVNNRYHLSDNITVGHNLSGTWSKKENRLGEAFGWTYRIPSTVSVYNQDGSYASTGIGSNGNVIAALNYHNDFTKTRALIGNAFVEIEFLKHFQFKSSLGIDLKNARRTNFNPVFFVDNTQKNQENSLDKTWAHTQNWLWENTVNYNQTFNDIHDIKAVVGFTTQENNWENLAGNRKEIFANNRDLWYLNAGVTEGLGNGNGASSSSIVSYLGRVNYTLMDKYLLTATLRLDGSSKFPENDRWGTFPSFALGWRIAEEPFMQGIDWLSDLKIRGSWGQIGNQKIGDYRYYATAATGINYAGIWGNTIDPGAAVTDLVNQNITWEKSEQTDIGLQFAFLNSKIEGELDWYKRTTKDMLVVVGVPGSVGLNATEGNVGSVENKGLELSLNFNGSKNDWTYNIGLRASTIHNEVVDLGSKDELIGGNIGGGKNITRAKVGEPIGYFFGYKSLGPFDTQQEIDNAPTQSDVSPGDLQMADVNGDGMIDGDDRTKIGSPIPDYTGGLNLSVGYKAFELSVDMYGSFGNEIYDANNNIRFSGRDNFSKEWLDRWTGPGTSDRIPRISFGNTWNYATSTRWVHDGSFVKLQNVRLQYTIPTSILESLPLSSVKVYISGNNLHYFTKYNGLSPELPGSVSSIGNIENPGNPTTNKLNAGLDSNVYPVSSFYQFGASITF